MSLDEKLNSYLNRVPLNIQSIAYDLEARKILGEVGKKSILERHIKINDIDECISFCKARKISVYKFIREKVENLKFEATYPNFDEEFKSEIKNYYDSISYDYERDRTEDYNSFINNYLSQEFRFFMDNLSGKKRHSF